MIFNWLMFFSIYAQPANLQITQARELVQIKIENKIPVVYIQSTVEYTATRHAVSFVASQIVNEFVTLQKASSGQSHDIKYHSSISEKTFYEDTQEAYFNLKLTGRGKSVKVNFDRKCCHLRHLPSIYIQDDYPILHKDIIIIAPKTLSGFSIIASHLPSTTTLTKGLTEEGDSLWQYHFENIPPATQEYRQPHYSTIAPHLSITGGFKDLQEMYQWLLSLTQDKGEIETVKQKAEELTQHCITDKEKLAVLYEWIQQNIRYIAFETGIYAFKPEPPARVLQNKYSDCKGKAFLLKEMAQSLGLDVRLVWVHTSDSIPSVRSVPSLESINHVICAFYDGKEYLYMDPTTSYLPLGVLPNYIQGRDVLVENGSQGTICHIPTDVHTPNTEEVYAYYQLKKQTLEGKIKYSWKGMMKEYYATLLHQIPENQHTVLFQQLLAGYRPENQPDSISIEGKAPRDSVTAVCYTLRNKTDIQTASNLLLLQLNGLQPFISPIDTTERKKDYLYPFPYEQGIHVTLILSEEYKIESLPENIDVANQWFRCIRTCHVKHNVLSYHYRFIFLKPLVCRKDMEEFNRCLDQERVYASEQICLIYEPYTNK